MITTQEILGLNKTDFLLLQFLNKMGALPASSISTRMSINRSTVFSALKRLKSKGLLYEIPKKGTTFFAVVEKENIITTAKTHLEEEKKKFSQILEFAEMLDLEKNSGGIAPKVAFYEGNDGLISLFQKTLSLGKKQEAFLTLEKIPKKILQYLQTEFIDQKRKKSVFSRVLIPYSDRAEQYANLDILGNRQTRFVSDSSPFETEIIICEKSVILIDFKEGGIGVSIESNSISNTLRAVFEIIWNSSKK